MIEYFYKGLSVGIKGYRLEALVTHLFRDWPKGSLTISPPHFLFLCKVLPERKYL